MVMAVYNKVVLIGMIRKIDDKKGEVTIEVAYKYRSGDGLKDATTKVLVRGIDPLPTKVGVPILIDGKLSIEDRKTVVTAEYVRTEALS
jgi:hypothetical protein